MINILMNGKRHRRVGTIDTGTAGIYQVLNTVMTATLENVGKADDVAVDIGHRVLDGITDACLRSKVHDPLGFVQGEGIIHGLAVSQVSPDMGVIRVIGMTRKARLLDRRIVVIIVIIDADDMITALEQSQHQGRADKTSRSGDEDFHEFLPIA